MGQEKWENKSSWTLPISLVKEREVSAKMYEGWGKGIELNHFFSFLSKVTLEHAYKLKEEVQGETTQITEGGKKKLSLLYHLKSQQKQLKQCTFTKELNLSTSSRSSTALPEDFKYLCISVHFFMVTTKLLK